MQNKYLLSICIPTCNQPYDLRRTLHSILPQLTDEVEIVIGDDSDNLETEKMIAEDFQNSQIRYFNNNGTLGIDKNILKITKFARGKYIWWFGDDEIRIGAITRVLEILKNHPDISMIFINYIVSGQNLAAINLNKDKFFEDRNQVLEEIANGLTFASAILFKKDVMRNLDQEVLNRFMGSKFVNFYLVMHILSDEGKFYFLSTPYVICYPTTINKIIDKVLQGGIINNDGFQVFGITLYNIIQEFKNKFNRHSLRKMLAKNFSYVWRGMLVGWIGGWDTPKGKRWKMFKLYWSFPEFWIAIVLFLMPLWVNKILYKIYKMFFSHRRFKLIKK
ncbi:glycosyltransferase family 2 protein [Candidatus Wolfebacteria bacterium]|nr:glycosyltransferase family 2 protein [Candidatus Wolfebacteria bacterium]